MQRSRHFTSAAISMSKFVREKYSTALRLVMFFDTFIQAAGLQPAP